MEIEAAAARRRLPELTDLLVDAVDGGGGNGFLRPLAPSVASAYWEGRIGDIESGRSILLASHGADGALLGIVVVDLAGQQNGQHRAEVTKLMVLSSARRQGLGSRLIVEAEDAARARGRWLLVLDTVPGSDAERLYRGGGHPGLCASARRRPGADGRLLQAARLTPSGLGGSCHTLAVRDRAAPADRG